MSVKIIHCADLHLDSKMESNLSSEQAETRRQELLQTFKNMITYAQNNAVQAIIIAGDLFDTAKSAKRTIKKQVIYLIESAPSITFYYLRGNHDNADFFQDTNQIPSNLSCFTSDAWTSYNIEPNICITGRELPRDIPESIYHELSLDIAKVNIVTLHGQIAKSTGKADAPLINVKNLENKYIDYLALGHIHSWSHDKLDARGTYGYAGCLEGRGFDECGEKGFVEITVDGSRVSETFVPLAARRLHEVICDITALETFSAIMDKIKNDTAAIPQKDLVKIVLRGEVTENTDITTSLYEQHLNNDFFFEKIYDETEIKIDYEKYRNDISLKGEFVRTVESQNIPDDDKAHIIIVGLKALAGKELN